MPHLLSHDEKRRRIQCASAILSEFVPEGPKPITDVVTGEVKPFLVCDMFLDL